MLKKRETYVVELDSMVSFKKFTLFNGYLDNTSLINSINDATEKSNKKLLDVAKFFEKIKPLSIRKYIRRLPEDVAYLTTTSGKKFNVEGFQKLLVVETFSKIDVNTLNDELKTNKTVKKITHDAEVAVSTWPPNDPYYTSQPQFYSSSYNIHLPRAWNYSAGNSGIKIAVVDNGIDYTHTDLGAGFGSGYRIRGGWDYKDNDSDPRPTYSTETHGTPIAGILGAINWNNTGVVGIAGGSSSAISSGCQIFSLRVTDEDVSENGVNMLQASLISEAVFEAATDPSVNNGFGYGVNVINCSFGSLTGMYWDWGSLFYQSYYNSFAWEYINNVVVVASRGNVGGDVTAETVIYPASFSNGHVVMSISGVNDYGYIASQSCYGNGVTLSAPFYLNYTTQNNNSYGDFAGTSNSAPFVAGVSALVFSKFRERSMPILGEDVQEILKKSAEPTSDPYRYGSGRLNAGQALHISSAPFNMLHLTASTNRTVTTVSNPSNNLIAFYYPYGLYAVAETKKIQGTVHIPDSFILDSTWVWANSNTDGFEWGNPSYGMPGATKISQNGRDVTFETYVYRMMPIGGSSLYWYPASPDEANIQVTVLGKQPLTATMSGPTYLSNGQSGTWTVTASGGIPPYSYSWSYFVYCDEILGAATNDGKEIIITPDNVPCGYWFSMGSTTNTASSTSDGRAFQVKCVVTDASNSTYTVTKNVDGSSSILAKQNISDSSKVEMLEKENYTESLDNYPNPFNPTTKISFSIPNSSHVSLKIFDILGREIAVLANQVFSAGRYTFEFNASNLPSGTYIYHLRTDNKTITKKMLIIK
ncbi:MAG: S8 family serine peptidase [Stygiobacter sp.]